MILKKHVLSVYFENNELSLVIINFFLDKLHKVWGHKTFRDPYRLLKRPSYLYPLPSLSPNSVSLLLGCFFPTQCRFTPFNIVQMSLKTSLDILVSRPQSWNRNRQEKRNWVKSLSRVTREYTNQELFLIKLLTKFQEYREEGNINPKEDVDKNGVKGEI